MTTVKSCSISAAALWQRGWESLPDWAPDRWECWGCEAATVVPKRREDHYLPSCLMEHVPRRGCVETGGIGADW